VRLRLRWEPVQDNPSDLVLKDRDEVGEIMQILFRAMNRGCEMAIKKVGDLKNLIPAQVLCEQADRTLERFLEPSADEFACTRMRRMRLHHGRISRCERGSGTPSSYRESQRKVTRSGHDNWAQRKQHGTDI
jgi:hypothetical protein